MEAADFAEPPMLRSGACAVSADLPLVSMLKTRMQWHQSCQKILAET